MSQFLLRILAAVTACSTALAAMPSVPAVALVADCLAGSIAAAPADGDLATEPRDGDSAEEREEESESKVHLLACHIGGDRPTLHVRRFASANRCRWPSTALPSGLAIRGPPRG